MYIDHVTFVDYGRTRVPGASSPISGWVAGGRSAGQMRPAAGVAPMLALVLLPASAAAIAGRAVGDGGPTCASPHDAVCLDCAAVGGCRARRHAA